MEFGNLHIEGFKSIPELDINLGSKGLHIIRGSNGYGKSTLIDSLVWCLYGIALNEVSDVNTWKKFRPKDYQGTLVSVYFSKGTDVYKVTRCYNYTGDVEGQKGRSQLFFYKNTELSDKKKKAEIQQEIKSAIGISSDLFINSIFFGQGLRRLNQLNGTSQKEIFDEIFDMSFIMHARAMAKEEYSKRQSNFTSLSNSLKISESSLKVLEKTLKNAQKEAKEFKKNKREEIASLRESKKSSTKALKDLELKAPNQYISTKEIKEIEDKIKEVKGLLKEAKNTKDDVTIEDLVNNIIGLLEEDKTKEAIKQLKSLAQAFNSIEVYQTMLDDLGDQRLKLYKTQSEQKAYINKIETLQSRVDFYTRNIKKAKEAQPSSMPQDLEEKIEKQKTSIQQYKAEIEKVEEELENYKWAYTEPLGNNGLKAYIFENSLKDLNTILLDYSNAIGITIQFFMDTSSARKEFSTYIKMEGETVLYKELSGGQKQLVNLVMAFAMNELVSYQKGFNITFLDEVFENLSYDNIELVTSMIRKIFKDKTLYLITHHDSLPIANAKVIEVTRENGLSQYKL